MKVPIQKIPTGGAEWITGPPTIQLHFCFVRNSSPSLIFKSYPGMVIVVSWQVQTFGNFPENFNDVTTVKVANKIS